MEDNYVCYECAGEGRHYWKYTTGEYFESDGNKNKILCLVCNGSGKINWIENIFRSKKFNTKLGYGPVKINEEE